MVVQENEKLFVDSNFKSQRRTLKTPRAAVISKR